MQNTDEQLVSVIIPCCNVEDTLFQCVMSISCQTYPYLEILIIDDGSKDHTLKVAKNLAKLDKRIKVISKKNEGYGATCNRGLKEATGQWISIVEPDDYIEYTMYAEMLKFARSFPERIDIIKTPWVNVNEWNNNLTQYETGCDLEGRMKTSKRSFSLKDYPVLIEGHPAIWSALFNHDFLRENNICFHEYPGAGWADNPFLMDTFARAQHIVYLNEPFYNYRCDLKHSTLHHTTDDAIARPFDRWTDMTATLNDLKIDDEAIWRAHIYRGFRYIDGAIIDDGWSNPLVKERTYDVFSLMDEDIVMHHPKLKNFQRNFFLRVLGKDRNAPFNLGRIGYVLAEFIRSLRLGGIKGTLKKIRYYSSKPNDTGVTGLMGYMPRRVRTRNRRRLAHV